MQSHVIHLKQNIKLGNGDVLVLPVINKSEFGIHSRSLKIQTRQHNNIETTYHQI